MTNEPHTAFLGEVADFILAPILRYLERHGIFGGFFIVLLLGLAIYWLAFAKSSPTPRSWVRYSLAVVWCIAFVICVVIQVMMIRATP